MKLRCSGILAATLAAGCQPQPAATKPPPVASIEVRAPAATAAPAASSAPAPPAAAPVSSRPREAPLAQRSHRRSEGGGCPDYTKGMAAGRKRTATGDYQGAIEAFTEALRARPVDARAWAELGYAALLAGKDAGPALLRARTLTVDNALLAQVWFNEGLFRERRGEEEPARIAFAVAEAHGSNAAEKKLEGASRCAATWTTYHPELEDISFVRSWREVFDVATPMCISDEPKTEADAKKALCFGCLDSMTPGNADACAGPKPWRVPRGDMQRQVFETLVQPLPNGRFYVELLSDGAKGAPLAPIGDALVRETRAPIEREETEIALPVPNKPHVTNRGFWTDDMPSDDVDGGAFCKPLVKGEVELDFAICSGCGQPLFPFRGPRELRHYAPKTGRERIRLTVWSGDVKATIRGSTATIAGGGCQATVTLPAD